MQLIEREKSGLGTRTDFANRPIIPIIFISFLLAEEVILISASRLRIKGRTRPHYSSESEYNNVMRLIED